MSFVSPSCDIKAQVIDAHAGHVGCVSYGISPLQDRIYIYEIEIYTESRRQGFGMAVVRQLANTYQQPITPIHVLGSSIGFWAAVRRCCEHSFVVTDQLRASEMDEEKARWDHLNNDSLLLKKEIHCRSTNGESWDAAVGTGLTYSSK